MKYSLLTRLLAAPLFALFASAAPGTAASAPIKPRVVRWVVAHARDDKSYDSLLDGFAKSVAEKSGGRLKIVFADPGAENRRHDLEAPEAAYKDISAGKADMGQIDVDLLGAAVIESPFLFRSYEHAEAVWRGPAGDALLAKIGPATGGTMRGLAFSYSGGYRIMVGGVAVRGADGFKGVKIRDHGSAADLFRALGSEAVRIPAAEMPEDSPIALTATGKIGLEETEVNRFAYFAEKFPAVAKKIKYANLTRHSMLVTSMIVNERFYSALDAPLRSLLAEQVRALAVAERRLSVNLAARNLEKLKAAGIEVVSMPEAEARRLAALALAREKLPAADAETVAAVRAVKDLDAPGLWVASRGN